MSKRNLRNYSTLIIGGICLLKGFFISGCVAQPKIDGKNSFVFQKRINEFVYHSFDFELGQTLSEIVKALGEPCRTTRRDVTNIHNPS